MADAGKHKRRRNAVAAATARTADGAPPGAANPVVRRLEPRPALPASGTPGGRRWLRRGLVLVGLAALAVPAGLYLAHRAQHVVSANAAVRGHLADVGVASAGVVTEVLVDAGDRVRSGDVLVRLQSAGLAAEVDEAQADLEGLDRELELKRMRIEHARAAFRQQREEARAEVEVAAARSEAARVRADDARETEALHRGLHESNGAISGQAVREATRDRLTAEANLREAEAELAAARSAERKAALAGDEVAILERELAVLDAERRRATARLQRARAERDAAVIRAPADGAVVRRLAEPGSAIGSGQPVVTLWLGDELWIEAWVQEDDIGAVAPGERVSVTLQSFPDREFAGRVERIGLATDFEMPEAAVPQPRSTRMRQAPVIGVRIRLENPPATLKPGMSAVVAIARPAA